VTALAVDLVPEHDGDTSYPDALLEVAAATTAPVVALTGLPAAVDVDAADRLRSAGIPVLEGFRSGLLALRHLLDSVDRPAPDVVSLVEEGALAPVSKPGEWADQLSHYGIPVPASRTATNTEAVVAAADEVGWPVVLKTAAPGVAHRSDVAGVVTGLHDAAAVEAAYADLAARLGPAVSVHRQVAAGVELSVGLVRDDALGPMVVVAAGGVLVELLSDRAVALPPLSRDAARRMVDRLRIRPLLDGFRGSPPADVEALVDVVVAVSHLAHERGDELAALDLNPVIVSPEGAVAVDVLMVPLTPEEPA
jgi:acyl-CoA synthetase (NDP forming)